MKTLDLFLTLKMRRDPEVSGILAATEWDLVEDDSITACSYTEYPTWGTGIVAGQLFHGIPESIIRKLDAVFKDLADLRRVDVKTHRGKKAITYFEWRDFKPGDRTIILPREQAEPKQQILSCCE